jgi:DNA (cytosine-5)-methyltransferase 1
MRNNSTKNPADPLPLLSLFCGPGGLDIGFEQTGFSPLLALDKDSAAVESYNWNRNNSKTGVVFDLSEVGASEIDTILKLWDERAGKGIAPIGIIGGPPCQSFSVSNVHRLSDDPRAKLPLSYAKILDAINKRFDLEFFLFENVAGLGNRPHSDSLELFIGAFENAGFDVKQFYLEAADFGLPQYRKRMFLVGFNNARYRKAQYVPPKGEGSFVTVRDVLGDLPEPLYFAKGLNPKDFGLHPNHWCMNPKSKKFLNGTLKPGEMLGRSFRMLNWEDRSWTVAYGHREVHVHPNGRRRLSVYEAMILQGFPQEYELRGTLSAQIRQVSDAVPPPLAGALAESILKALNSQLDLSLRSENSHHLETGQASQSGVPTLQTDAPRSTIA